MPEPATRAAMVEPTPRRAGWLAWLTCVAVLLIFLRIAMPLIPSGRAARATDDERGFHLPTIEQFADTWPHPDLRDYKSATTPGYHMVLAAARRFTVADLNALRWFGSLFTIGLLATMALYVSRHADPLTGLVVCLPALCSLYVLSSGIRLLPDNAGWWGVTGMLILGFRRRSDAVTWVLGALVLLALVLVRQIHLWAASMLLVAAWTVEGEPHDRITPARVRRLALAAVAVLPSVVMLAWFFHLWHGALPPSARALNAGANPAVPAMVLAVVGVVGALYSPLLVRRLPELRRRWRVIAATALAAGIVAVIPATDYNVAAGRWSGLWNVVKVTPTFAHRSPLLVGLTALGGAVLATWAAALHRRDRWVFLTAVVAFTAAHAMTHEAYQRYYEPFALILFALATSRLPKGDPPPRWAIVGPLLLAALLGTVAGIAMR